MRFTPGESETQLHPARVESWQRIKSRALYQDYFRSAYEPGDQKTWPTKVGDLTRGVSDAQKIIIDGLGSLEDGTIELGGSLNRLENGINRLERAVGNLDRILHALKDSNLEGDEIVKLS